MTATKREPRGKRATDVAIYLSVCLNDHSSISQRAEDKVSRHPRHMYTYRTSLVSRTDPLPTACERTLFLIYSVLNIGFLRIRTGRINYWSSIKECASCQRVAAGGRYWTHKLASEPPLPRHSDKNVSPNQIYYCSECISSVIASLHLFTRALTVFAQRGIAFTLICLSADGRISLFSRCFSPFNPPLPR